MTVRKFKNLACLAKIEATYGIDSVPTAAANAIQLSDVTFTPVAGEEVKRDILRPYLGNQGTLFVADYTELKCKVEIAGSGAPGTAPGFGPLLRACSIAEVITATTSAAYNPISSGQEAVSIYFVRDGVKHVMLGARGTATLSLAPKEIPQFEFTLRGLCGPITDAAMPAAVYTGYQTPLVVSVANTPTWTLHDYATIAESLSIDLANTVEPRILVNKESIEVTDRQATGTMVVQATSLAEKDWFSIYRAHTRGTLSIVHGKTAGNIVEISAPQVQIGRPTEGQTQGILNYSLPLLLCTGGGNDELTLTFR